MKTMRKNLASPLWQRGATEGFGERKWHTVAFSRVRMLGGVAWQDRRNETGVGKTTEEAAIQGKDNEALNEGRSREKAEGTDAVMVGLTGPGRTTAVGGQWESSLKPRFVVPGMGQQQIVQLTSWPHSRITPPFQSLLL